jgi:hypothetical protein
MTLIEVVRQGGLLGTPSSVMNLVVREIVRAAERRAGVAARVLRVPAAAFFVVSNAAGRLLETLSAHGPAASLLAGLDARGPQNFLVVAERPS